MPAKPVGWGEPAPWFDARTPINPRFVFSSLGGRFVALTFLGRSSEPAARRFLEALTAAQLVRDDERFVSYGVSFDEADLQDELAGRAFPPQRVFHDAEGSIAASYGLLDQDAASGKPRLRARWFILDPMLRVLASGSLDQAAAFVAALRALPRPGDHAGLADQLWAPVLLMPRVLEPAFCRSLIEAYRQGQPEASGFMRTEGGKTVARLDPSFKKRSDVFIQDESLRVALRDAIRLRLVPEIEKAFQFKVTRIERYVVACYEDQDGGFFRAHRDNTTAGTAHRRFAVTINLNAEDYDGGELWFPEFGTRRYKPPSGAAIVFSCSLLHEATPVTRGQRYATLPFLYDDAAARIREANNQFLGDGVGAYRS